MPSVFYLQSSSTCEEENAFLTGESYSVSSAVTSAWGFAVPCHSYTGEQIGENFKVWGHDFRIDGAKVSTKTLWWSSWCAQLHMAWNHLGEAPFLTFLLWDEVDEGKHSDFLVFQHSSSQSYCCPLRQEFQMNNAFFIPKKWSYDLPCWWKHKEFMLPWGCCVAPVRWLLLAEIHKFTHKFYISQRWPEIRSILITHKY